MIFFENIPRKDSESAVEKSFSGSSSNEYEKDFDITPDKILDLFEKIQQNQLRAFFGAEYSQAIEEDQMQMINRLCSQEIKCVADKSTRDKTLEQLQEKILQINNIIDITEKIKEVSKKGPQARNSKGMLENIYRGAIKMCKQISGFSKTEEELLNDTVKVCELGKIQREQLLLVEKLTQEKAAILAQNLIPCVQKIWEEQELIIEQCKNEQKAAVAVLLIQLTQSIARQKEKDALEENLEGP